MVSSSDDAPTLSSTGLSTSQLTVMTVCTGNICRSPMAESILRAKIEEAGLGHYVTVDSTAITSGEVGSPIDPRAYEVLSANGYDPLPSHQARQVTLPMAASRTLLLPMTAQHARALRRLFAGGILPATSADPATTPDIRMYRTFDPALADVVGHDDFAGKDGSWHSADDASWDIADPWYGGPDDFELTLAEVEAGAQGIVAYLRERLAA